ASPAFHGSPASSRCSEADDKLPRVSVGQSGRDMIDSHQHFWWIGRHAYSWSAAVGDRLARDFTPDDLRPELAPCGITGSVLVQVLPQLEETEEFLDLCRTIDFVRGVVGWVPLADPEAAARALTSLRARGPLLGVRHLISYEPDPGWLVQEPVVQ